MKHKKLARAILLILLISLLPVGAVLALAVATTPPPDMFQLPWELGLAWVAIDGIDNGSKRPLSSSHQYTVGGAIDFAPRANMIKGEDTSNYWTTAAAGGTVVGVSSCHVIIDHGNGWTTQYYFLANVQVKLGDVVSRNQRLGIIADGVRNKFCPGSLEPNVPHLHFMLRPSILDATFAGWKVNYNSFFNITTFTRDGTTVGLFKPLLNTMGLPPTPPPTPTGPYISTSAEPSGIDIGGITLVTVRLNNVPPEGYTSVEVTCPYDSSLLEVSNMTVADLFGADPAVAINDLQMGNFIVAIAGSHGNKATTSGTAFTFNAKGLQAGQAQLECKARVSTGNNQLTDIPSTGTVLTVLGIAPTPTFIPTITPSPTPSITPAPTTPVDAWLTFTNVTYGFLFKYPPQGMIGSGGNDNFTRIDLPFVQGTNLREKYLEMIVVENANPCQSPLATQSMVETSETVVINGISFLKQTGGDAGAGNYYQWVAYSTFRDTACVSLDFILHSLNPGNFPTPPPVFDYAAESAVFEQVVSTYTWLTSVPTATPTPLPDGMLAGRVIAAKPVTVSLYNMEDVLVATASASLDGAFTFTAPAGTYTTVASSSGFLNAQASVTLTGGNTTTLTTINLPAGDIDGSNVIDQFDAMTIGMNYNSAEPSIADLNGDGIINVLDLEALAGNYRKTGPVVWQ
ncbi:MAG TPA: peptidoglycan DD-metalloendopeptidase family protein [Anaerolineales bacterium]|nr:peptidoglycan DD-metalloendopeptidase family protein [Anaerolineales bacterium]